MDFILVHYFLAQGTYSAVNLCGQKKQLMAQPLGCGVLSIHTYYSIGSHMITNGSWDLWQQCEQKLNPLNSSYR
jgi:hypothetical protein